MEAHLANLQQQRTQYSVLSLSGGGARGIFQAALLARLERDLDAPLYEKFDMIAATSTGGLIGLALAAGKTADAIYAAYRDHGRELFDRRALWFARRGARYSGDRLREVVEMLLGTDHMDDLRLDVVICASGVDNFQGRLFTRQDKDLPLVDVAMATAAAPTYFPPVVPRPHAGGYVDGGLWANDPSHVAVSYAVHTLGVASDSIKLMSIGTGRVTRGQNAQGIGRRRVASLDTLRFVLDISADLQSWHSANCCEQILGREHIIRINPELPQWIKLDDAKMATNLLPGLADTTYDQRRDAINTWFALALSPPDGDPQLPDVLLRGLRAGGVTRFIPSRQYYGIFREGRESITAYIQLATSTLSMVSINLATGVDMERIVDVFTVMICRRPDPVRIRVSLLNPARADLMTAIAPVLAIQPDILTTRIGDAITSLADFARELPPRMQRYFSLSCHNALPAASAIMIDEASPTGLIQLESKPYGSAFTDSFAWEIGHGTDFYRSMTDSYSRLISDGDRRVGNPW
jgi:predicted acylesterase/phospholipase RssA